MNLEEHDDECPAIKFRWEEFDSKFFQNRKNAYNLNYVLFCKGLLCSDEIMQNRSQKEEPNSVKNQGRNAYMNILE